MLIRLQVSAFLILLIAAPVHLQDECVGNSCYPHLGDLVVGRAAQLAASSTCGLYRPQNYCILGYLENEKKCFICDSRSSYNLYQNPNSHRIENVITTFQPERKTSWWQSENGVHGVSIQLDLEAMFQFSHLILTFKSFRPAAMLVERSKDFGQTWKVFRYFAEDCENSFPGIPKWPADSVDDVICDSRYSGAEPSTDGEVVLKALDPSFDIHDPYNPTIQELITVTNLRVNFTRLLTLGDTLLSRRRRNPEDKYYYALYEMVVRGTCFCNGHASQCVPLDSVRGDTYSEPGMVHGRCVCKHNTTGYNCERCQDFYHDAPWRPGGETDSDVCRRCNCNGHSEKCHFELSRYLATGGVSGGVCENCRNNRIGAQCELCAPYYYQDPQRLMEDPNACIRCECNQDGSVDGGLCDAVTGQCVCKKNVEGERCDRCKFGFYGLSQDDTNGCQLCRCNFLGTIRTGSPCDQTTGRCICEHFAHGLLCDGCLPGYWGLGNTVYGCIPCDCDIGGALKTECSSEDGQCECRPNMVGQRCSDPAAGYFLAPLDFYIYEAENAVPLVALPLVKPERPTKLPLCPVAPIPPPTPKPEVPYNPTVPPVTPAPYNSPITLPICEHYFRQRGYDFKISNGRIVVVKREKRQARKRRQNQRAISFEPGSSLQIIPRQRAPDKSVTWTGLGFVRVQDGAGLRFTITNIPSTTDYYVVVRYEPESADDWTATVHVVSFGSGDGSCPNDPSDKVFILPGSARAATLDSPLCFRFNDQYHVEVTFRRQPNANHLSSSYILIDSLGLIPKVDSLPNFCSKSQLAEFQQYRCVELGAQVGEHTLPEVCERLIGSISAFIHNGAVACNCHPVGAYGSSCSKFGGQCECKPNIIGRCCDTCTPLTYGFGPDGCSSCDCDPSGSTAKFCDQRSGQCPCRDGVTGRRCDKCYPGYYGFPLCRRCQCNNMADFCDPVTGVCLDCREHSTGPHCERCEDGYIGDPVTEKPCEPCLCPELKGNGRFFAISCNKDPFSGVPYCECLPGHTGPRCDICTPGYYGDLRVPSARCKACDCNNNIDPLDGDACDALTGKCLQCLHNTEGPRCQSCKRGYYGNALAQDCKACSCNPRGTDTTRCPAGSPCFCDQETGQCPCRTGVKGVLCNECADGYWNLDGESGCEPCNCDPEHALSNICDKITGQCLCQSEYGGKRCDECGPNHFGNPDIQCMSCDCDPSGSTAKFCDQRSGQCPCRDGVTSRQCDKCYLGYYGFPLCRRCQCNNMANICDPVTGVCLDCREHSTGPHCERCEDGYIGDPVTEKPCEPCLCPELKGNGRFFAIACNKDPFSEVPYCECLPGHTGPRCDICTPGYYGDLRVPSARCKECDCNNNIDPLDGDACDALTGKCLRCLHNTEGPRCQSCKRGYFGNALAQDCKECSCNPRGTKTTRCPAGSPCFCDQKTGQCPCRTGVEGVLCNECADGYWNLDGESGCEPCNCDPEHALSNVCDKITGQCLCQPEYGGKRCDECGPNHFGNPDIQCMSCDCNMEGTINPACDPYTGECLCKPGVTGLFCDECGPGHDTIFPNCEPCHTCYQLWENIVSDVKLDTERMETIMPCPEISRPIPDLERLQALLEKIQLNMTDQDEFEKLEKLLAHIKNETETIDPNIIIIDPSILLNTDINNIRLEFNRLLNNLKEKIPMTDIKSLNDNLNKIRKLYDQFTENKKKVEAAKKAQEASQKTRESAALELTKCRIGEIKTLEKNIKALSVAKLNEEICGAPGEVKCEQAKCGGATCGKCGGPGCTGSLPISLDASKLSETTKKNITDLHKNIKEANAKLIGTTKMTDYVKDQAKKMMNKINQSKSEFEKEKIHTKKLLEKIKNYLRDELVKPEDIEKLANAVLSIQLPKSPDEIRKMIEDIKKILANVTGFNEDLKRLEKEAKIAEKIKERAKEILNKNKAIDVSEIEKALNPIAQLHDKIIDDLAKAEDNIDSISDTLNKAKPKLENIEENLNSNPAEELLDEIKALKTKTEMNRAQGKEAKAAGKAALTSAEDGNKNLEELKEQFEKLKSNDKKHSVNEEANKRLKNITAETEKLAKDAEDKMKQIEELEKRIQDAVQRKEEKIKDLEDLQKEANDLKDFIADKVDKYLLCST